MTTQRLDFAAAQDVVASILIRNRTSEANARSVARALVMAEADGQKGHGFSRLPTYAAQARCGKIDGMATPRAERTAPGVLAIDAGLGFAYPALDLAVAELPAIASEQGIALASIGRSSHCGAMGLVVERLADVGLFAFMVANSPGAMAPWGGRRALYGTNPLACAFPRPDQPPVVIDMSLSKVARGNLISAQQKHEQIPLGWALDAEGKPTTDPAAGLAGTMVPMGDAKGTALALMVEAMAAGLTGSNYAYQASSFLDAEGGPSATGQLLIAIDPGRLGGAQRLQHMELLFAEVAREEGVRLPGSRRFGLRQKAEQDGIAIPASLLAEAGAG